MKSLGKQLLAILVLCVAADGVVFIKWGNGSNLTWAVRAELALIVAFVLLLALRRLRKTRWQRISSPQLMPSSLEKKDDDVVVCIPRKKARSAAVQPAPRSREEFPWDPLPIQDLPVYGDESDVEGVMALDVSMWDKPSQTPVDAPEMTYQKRKPFKIHRTLRRTRRSTDG